MIEFVFIFNTIWLTSQWSLAESSYIDLHWIPQEFVCIVWLNLYLFFNTIWLTSQWSLAESSHTDLHWIPQEFVCITDSGDSFPALFAPDLN